MTTTLGWFVAVPVFAKTNDEVEVLVYLIKSVSAPVQRALATWAFLVERLDLWRNIVAINQSRVLECLREPSNESWLFVGVVGYCRVVVFSSAFSRSFLPRFLRDIHHPKPERLGTDFIHQQGLQGFWKTYSPFQRYEKHHVANSFGGKEHGKFQLCG